MSRIHLSLVASCAVACLALHGTSARAAEAAPAVEGDVTEAHVGGLNILVKRVKNAEVVTAQLYVRGGARNWSKDDAGIEQLAFHVASTGGTQMLPKSRFSMKLASLGVNIEADTGRAASWLQAKGPLVAFDEMFGLLVDCFLRPAMPTREIEVARQQQLAQIASESEDPDARLGVLVNDTLFKGHPYANRAEGTAESVQKLTPRMLTAHLAGLRETSRLQLIVVGDIDADKVINLARAAFAGVPQGKWTPTPLPKPTFAASTLTTEERTLPTNYIQGMGAGPTPGTAEYAAALAMNTYLWEKLFEEVRTKRNLSYAPGVRIDASEVGVYVGIYVTAVDPNTTLPVMTDVLKRVQTTPLTTEELAATKAQSRTNMLTNEETTDAQASSLARGLFLSGDWRMQKKLVDQIAGLSAADLQAYAKKYFGKLQVVMLGDPKKLDAKVATGF